MRIARRSKSKHGKGDAYGIKYEAKGKSLNTKKLFANITYYKLRAQKHFGYYIIGLGNKGYGIGGTEEILNQALMIPRVRCVWKTMGKKPKIVARAGLCSSQRHGSTMMNTMKSNLSDMVRDVVQANHQHGTPSVDESYRILRS